MKKILVSIIIPIYNAEKYLKDLFDSINKQTYKNYEVILINDGSTDNSEQKCLEFLNNNNRVKYYKKENTGVSDTRNFGIKKSLGDYICFIDADDILEKDYLLDFVTTLPDSNTNLICCDYSKFNSYKDIQQQNESVKIIKEFSEKDKYEILYSNYCGYLWNKFFSRKIIVENNLKFDTSISMMEDLLFIFKYLEYINRIICINKKNYNYRQISNSASKNLSSIKWFSNFKVLNILNSNKKKFNKKALSSFSYSYLFYIYEAKFRLNYIKKDKEYLEQKKLVKKQLEVTKGLYKNLSKKQKIKIFLYKHFNRIFFKLKKGV